MRRCDRVLQHARTGILVSGPTSLQTFSGDIASFSCVGGSETQALFWKVNGDTDFQQNSSFFASATHTGYLYETDLTIDTSKDQFNRTVVQCILVRERDYDLEYSNNATLLVQG